MREIFFCAAIVTAVAACTTPPTPIAPTPATTDALANAADNPNPSPSPSPTVSPAQACDDLIARAQPGLYVVSFQPDLELVWDRVPRRFIVEICNTFPEPTTGGGKFVAFVYYPNEARPRGQTSELTTQIDPGLHEITLASWIPGLENHVIRCSEMPPIEVSVAYRYPPDISTYHPIRYADGKDRVTFTLKCGGNFWP